jgi:hypothetical protein
MTRLFDLESYSELCTHANLYGTEIPNTLDYKNSLDKYQKHGYRHDSPYPQQLTIKDKLIPLKHLGINLSKDGNDLYVIRDRLDSLSLRNFLNPGEKYIYRSVYHYWNYRQQISNNLDLTNSVVVIDLGSMSDEAYCCLQFKQVSHSPYPIPLIDNRREIDSDSNFKLALNVKDIHNNMCQDLAQKILSRNFPQLATNNNTIEHLKSYLQKIEVFKLVQSQQVSTSFSLAVEILQQERIYYKSVYLNVSLLEEVVINQIDIKALAQFIQKHSKHSFVLISDYNFLPKFKALLNDCNIFVPDNRLNEFSKIWQEKQQLNFPFFGQYLDKIKFQIQRDGEAQWIEVLSIEEQEHIYYEGDPQTKRFIARIQETGQEYFKLLYPDTVLPIQINDCDYCINDITQEYNILHPLSKLEASREELRVRIEFIIKLGSVPELKVTERENNYQIEAQLQDYIEIEPSLNCIPLKSILKYREQQFKNKIPNPILCKTITASISSVKKIDYLSQLPLISDHITAANKTIKSFRREENLEPFLYVNGNLESLKDLKSIINGFYNCGITEAITNYFNDRSTLLAKEKQNINIAVNNVLNLIGRTHKLSDSYISSLFFDQQFIQKATQKIGSQYYTFLAKVAFHKNFQIAYFSIFNSVSNRNKLCYQLEEYLWGYSRILLWYSEFYQQYQNKELDYLNHFKAIANYLLNNQIVAGSEQSKRYQQDAFLALIYLLTFRETDSSFCTKDSEEYQLAERVIEKYKISLVYLKAIADRSLNKCLEELLNGNSSQDTIKRIIEAD